MAEDIHNEGSEEEKNKKSNQDEDFGLPDLEFEELEELDLNIGDDDTTTIESRTQDPTPTGSDDEMLIGSDDIDMSVLDDIDIPDEMGNPILEEDNQSNALVQGIDEIEDVLDSAQLISDRLGDDGDDEIVIDDNLSSGTEINYDDLISSDSDIDGSESVDASFDDSSFESVTGLTDAELEALMIPPEPVADVESILSEGATEVDDLLASMDSPDDFSSLDMLGDDAPPVVDEQDEIGSSLFSADDTLEMPSSAEVESNDVGGSIFESDSISNQTETPEPSLETGSIFESDSIALEASSAEKVEFQAPEDASLPPNYKPYSSEGNSTGNFTKVILVGVVIITLIGSGLLYLYRQSDEGTAKKEIAKVEKSKAKVEKKKEATPAAKSEDEKASEEKSSSSTNKEAVKKEATPAKKTPVKKKAVVKTPVRTASPGEIVLVKERTGRFYAIIGSFIDEDIAMDYAKELSGKGQGVKIIYPFGSSRNYRVTIADYSSLSDATNNIDAIKADFGDGVWALKY